MKDIGTKLKERREELGLGVERVAVDANISAMTLRNLENTAKRKEQGRQSSFAFDTLMAVLAVLDVLPSEFLTGYDHESQMVA